MLYSGLYNIFVKAVGEPIDRFVLVVLKAWVTQLKWDCFRGETVLLRLGPPSFLFPRCRRADATRVWGGRHGYRRWTARIIRCFHDYHWSRIRGASQICIVISVTWWSCLTLEHLFKYNSRLGCAKTKISCSTCLWATQDTPCQRTI